MTQTVAVFVFTLYTSYSYTWNAISTLPTPMTYIIGGIIDNKIHILGGYDANGLQQYDYSVSIQYDTSLNTIHLNNWTINNIASSFPTITELGSNTQQYVNIDEFIYIMGTDDRINLEDAPGKLIIYNMKTQHFKDTSTYASSMILPRSANCVTTDKVYLYSIGGHDSIGYSTTDFIKYHIQSDKWSNGPSINYARHSSQCVLVYDDLYVIGGGSHSGSVLNMEILNLNAQFNGWSVVGSIPTAITSSFAYNIDSNSIYLAGGATAVSYGFSFSDAYLYNITNKKWIVTNSMVYGVHGFASVTYQPDSEWMFIIHVGGVSCTIDTVGFCMYPVYSPQIQYTKVKAMNTTGSDIFTTTHSHTTVTALSDTTSGNITTSLLLLSSTQNDMNTMNSGQSKGVGSNMILSIIESKWFYLSIIGIGVVLILFVIFMCICCIKKSKRKGVRVATESDDKTIPLRNPMVVLIGIGSYDENVPNCDLFDETFTDLPIDVDIKNLICLFRNELGYQIYPEYDETIKTHWTQNELIELLKTQAELLENNIIHNEDKFDGLILVLSSHGIQNHIVTSDHNMIEKHVIHRIFSIGHPKSRDIPRIVLLDSCDGDEFSKGARNRKQSDILISKQYGIKQLQSSSHKASWEKGTLNPDYKLAVILSSNVGFRSNMSRSKGSYVIYKFVEKTKNCLIQYGESRILSELFDEIQQELGDDKQLPVYMWNNGTGNVKLLISDMEHIQSKKQNIELRQMLKRSSNKINYQRV
eukprot:189331_1